MKLIKPSFKIETPEVMFSEMLQRLELRGRVCYKSEDKITEGSANKFIQMIINRGHETVLEHESISVRIVCDRGVSHELVRHRLASFSQESTRYCDYSGELTFIIPPWVNSSDFGPDFSADAGWRDAMSCAEGFYNFLRERGWKPEQARSVLPNSLKTEIVMTCNLREWRHFFKLRTAPTAHPQMREIASPMHRAFARLLPVVFNRSPK